MRKFLLVVLLLMLAGGGAWFFYNRSDEAAKKENYQTVAVAAGDITEEVTAQGKLEAKNYVDVGTQVSGQLMKIHVNIGDEVKEGELLVEIDPRIYQTKVAADEAHINTLKAQLAAQQATTALAQVQQTRNEKLIRVHAVSRDAYDQTAAALKTAQANVKALEAGIVESQSALDGDKTNLAYTKISAPMTGTVVDIPLREGQTVNASQTAPTILTIADLDVMTVRAQVAEADVMRLRAGMPVSFSTLGNMDRRWKGIVRQILPTPEVINNVVLYDVLIDVGNKDRQLMSGMSTQVFFTVASAKNVPTIPVTALTHRDAADDSAKGEAYIMHVPSAKGEKPQRRVVHIGISDRQSAQVLDGLSLGDKIILPAAAASSDTQKSSHFHRGARL